MQLVPKRYNISPSNKVGSYFCSSCCVGKLHKLPSHAAKSVYSLLELVFTDLGEPARITSRMTQILCFFH